jgi:hypothetical protein
MLPPGILLSLLCVYLGFIVCGFTLGDRMLKKRVERERGKRRDVFSHSEEDRLTAFYLWFYRVMTSLLFLVLLYTIIQVANS